MTFIFYLFFLHIWLLNKRSLKIHYLKISTSKKLQRISPYIYLKILIVIKICHIWFISFFLFNQNKIVYLRSFLRGTSHRKFWDYFLYSYSILLLHLCVSTKQYIVEDYFVFLHLHLYHGMCMIVSHSAILFTNYKVHLWELSMLIIYVLCLVTQSFLTLCDPVDCGPPSSSVHGDSPGKNTEVGCHAVLQGIFPTQVSRTASGFFTIWAPREALVTYRWILFILLFSSLLSYTVILSTHFLTHRLLQVCSLFWKCLHENV